MKLGYFPDVLDRDFDSTTRDDVEGLALVALPNNVRAVELVPVLIKGSRRWRDAGAPSTRGREVRTRLVTPRPSRPRALSIAPP